MADTTMARRSVLVPDDLWDRASAAADTEARRTGYRITVSDLIRRGLAAEIERIMPPSSSGSKRKGAAGRTD